MRFAVRLLGSVLVTSLLISCGGEPSATNNGPATDFAAGSWDITFDTLSGGGATCLMPSTVFTIEQSGTTLTGSYQGFGSALCSTALQDLPLAMTAGSLQGTAPDSTAQLFIDGPDFELHLAPDNGDLRGTVRRVITFPGSAPVQVLGSVHGRPHPATVPLGSAEFIRITPELLTVGLGDSLHYTVTVLGHNGQPLANQPVVTLTNSNPAAAVIGADGWIRPGPHAGPFVVSAATGGVHATAVGKIIHHAVKISIAPLQASINRASTTHLTVVALDAQGDPVASPPFTYTSVNPVVATVPAPGVVLASGANLGHAWIRVSNGELTDSMEVSVVSVPLQFKLSSADSLLAPGGSVQVQLLARDSNNIAVPDSQITVVSDNPALLSLSPSKLVSAPGPTGFARIIASSGGVADTLRIAVRSAPIPGVVDQTTLPAGTSPISVAVAPTGAMLIGDFDGQGVFRGDLPSHQLPTQVPTGISAPGVAITNDGSRGFVVSNTHAAVLVIDMATNQVVDSIVPLDFGGAIFPIALSPDGHTLAFAQNEVVRLYDPATLAPLGSIGLNNVVRHLSFHPTQQLLYGSTDEVHEINLVTKTETRAIGTGKFNIGADGVAVAADGSELYVTEVYGKLVIFDLPTGAWKERVEVSGNAEEVILAPTQDLLYITSATDDGIIILDRASRVRVATLNTPGVHRASLDPAGTTLVAPSIHGMVYFIH